MAQEEEAVDQPQDSILSSVISKCRCITSISSCKRCRSDRFPRTVAIVCGILLPMLGLIALTDVFGYWLARVESPPETVRNNQHLAATAVQMFYSRVLANLTAMAPHICLQQQLLHYSNLQENRTNDATKVVPAVDLLNVTLQEAAVAANQSASRTEKMAAIVNINLELHALLLKSEDKNRMDPQELLLVNSTEFYGCLGSVRETLETLLQWTAAFDYDDEDTTVASGELTFNWNRCTPYGDNSTARVSGSTERSETYAYSLRPAQQAKFFAETWEDDQSQLYKMYFNDYMNEQNLSIPKVEFLAWNQSVYTATGETACVVNIYSGAWYWFTVMTTIGYGTQAIQTTYGRVMVCTFGFLCMLAFGGILAAAGYVTTAIFDDALIRFRLRRLTIPWVACLFWGLLNYCWLFVIAQTYKTWVTSRLGSENEVTFFDAYWFAYVSTTTLGLGDYILAPEVLRRSDLVMWPLLFLAGFVLFASFIGKLSQLIRNPCRSVHATYLADRLRERGMVYEESRQEALQLYRSSTEPGGKSDNVDELGEYGKARHEDR